MALMRAIALILIGAAAYLAARALIPGGAVPVARDEIERQLMATPAARAVTVLRERAPEDHARVLAALAELLRDRSGPDDAAGALAATVSGLVRERAPDLRRAPQRSVVRVIEGQIAILEALRDDPASCGKVAMHGTGELGPAARADLAPVAAGAAADVLTALYDGRDSTAPELARPSERDFAEVITGWRQRGAGGDQVDLIRSPSAANPGLCPAVIGFLTYLSRTESMPAKRVRTDLVVAMLEG